MIFGCQISNVYFAVFGCQISKVFFAVIVTRTNTGLFVPRDASLSAMRSASTSKFISLIVSQPISATMPPPFRVIKGTNPNEPASAAVIPIAAFNWTFPDMPDTYFYVVGTLTVDGKGNWTLSDYTGSSMTLPVGLVRIHKGTSCSIVSHNFIEIDSQQPAVPSSFLSWPCSRARHTSHAYFHPCNLLSLGAVIHRFFARSPLPADNDVPLSFTSPTIFLCCVL
jgi:hypothetical protein